MLFEVGAAGDADEFAFGSGDDRCREVARAEAPGQFVGRRVGAHRRRTILHRPLGRGAGQDVQRAGAEPSEQNAGQAGDEREGIRDPRRDVTDRVGQPAGNDVGPGELAGGDQLVSPLDGGLWASQSAFPGT